MSFHKTRFAPTETPSPPPWPPHLTEAPDPRPLGHPRWAAFVRWTKSGRDRVNPAITDSASQYGLHGGQLWAAFLAGTEDAPEFAI